MGRPTIVVDDAIPHAEAALSTMGEVRCLPGRAIDNAALRDADVLVTRSVTRVDAALVERTPLSLVASATAGVDHIDAAALASADIAWTSAAGCNAQAVAEYVLASLMQAARARHRKVAGPVGVVGFGHVGRRTAALLRAYGLEVLACDPPLAERRRHPGPLDFDPIADAAARTEPLLELDALLPRCAALTLHVPLTATGPHATAGLMGHKALAALPAGATIIHTCRGGVLDEVALLSWLARGRGDAILDVFEGEPHLRHPQLLDPSCGALWVTPHIAGYTHEGKRNATQRAAEAVAAHLGVPTQWNAPAAPTRTAVLTESDEHALASWMVALSGLTGDVQRLRGLRALARADRGAQFERLRRGYALRSEHRNIEVCTAPGNPLTQRLVALGFAVRAEVG